MTMKQWLRRTLAALLTVALLLGVAPLPSAQAEVVQPVGPAIVARETVTAGGNKRSGAHQRCGGLGGRSRGDA